MHAPLTPDDPRLTAYVLGELDADQRDEVERQLATSAELREAAADIEHTTMLLGGAFDNEPTPTLTDEQRQRIRAAAKQTVAYAFGSVSGSPPTSPRGTPVVALASLVLLAGFVLVLQPAKDSDSPNPPRKFSAAADANIEVAQLDSGEKTVFDSLDLKTHTEFKQEAHGHSMWFHTPPDERPDTATPGLAGLPHQNAGEPTKNFGEGDLVVTAPAQAGQQGQPKSNRDGANKTYEFYVEIGDEKQRNSRMATPKPSDSSSLGTQTYSAEGLVAGKPGEIQAATEYGRIARPVLVNPAANTNRFYSYQAGDGQPGNGTTAPGVTDGYSVTAGQPGGPRVGLIVGQQLGGRVSGSANINAPFAPNTRGLPLAWRQQTLQWGEGEGRDHDFAVDQLGEFDKQRLNEKLAKLDGVNGLAAGDHFGLAEGISIATEQYEPIVENPFIEPVGQAALSTFSIDVDTASYSNVRRFLTGGHLPPPNAVRIEELVNYFRYDYPQPPDGQPFSVNTEVAACPWEPTHRLVRFGLKGREITADKRPPTNLVFLIDTSGSMSSSNKLALVQQGLQLLVNQMDAKDRVAIVTYAGHAGVALASTPGTQRDEISKVIQGLNAGGSTNGAAGIQMAYEQAVEHFIKDGANRVILCTDGDFNVGVSSDDELVKLIEEKRQSGVFLSVLGFGMGNLKDGKLEKLADKGNGFYGYIDDLKEATRIFEREMAGTLYTIAKDVKIQVEFNPAKVGAYRLIGYENRVLAARDFHDDRKDAGEIGAGHTVTALYEVIPVHALPAVAAKVDDLKYQTPHSRKPGEASDELLTLKLRYKQPDADKSDLFHFPVKDLDEADAEPSPEFEWQAAVAAFGMLLRNSEHKGQASFPLVHELAQVGIGPDPDGHRKEFLDLVRKAETLSSR